MKLEYYSKKAQGLIEYALIFAFVSLIAIASLTILSNGLNKNRIKNEKNMSEASLIYCQSLNKIYDEQSATCR